MGSTQSHKCISLQGSRVRAANIFGAQVRARLARSDINHWKSRWDLVGAGIESGASLASESKFLFIIFRIILIPDPLFHCSHKCLRTSPCQGLSYFCRPFPIRFGLGPLWDPERHKPLSYFEALDSWKNGEMPKGDYKLGPWSISVEQRNAFNPYIKSCMHALTGW